MPSRTSKIENSTFSAGSGGPPQEKSHIDDTDGDDIATLLAGLDFEAHSGTESDQEVIAKMTADDLDSDRAPSADCQNQATEIDSSASPPTPDDSAECQNEGTSEFTGMSKPAGDFDILPNQKRYVSVFRDARTMRQIRVLHDSPEFSGDTTLLVTKPLFPSLYPSPSTSTPHKRPHTSYTPWWDERPALPSPARQYRTPAPWRDTSDHLKVTFRHVALKMLGSVYSLNLNLSPDIEDQARDYSYPLGWLHDRVGHHLKQALGRPVQFHLVLEEAGTDHRLHLHGELQVSAEELPEARGALRKAGGIWDGEARQKQLVMAPDPDAGWSNYIVGDLWRVGFTRNVLPRVAPDARLTNSAITFPGGATSSTDLLNKKAAEIYEAHRRLLKMNKV